MEPKRSKYDTNPLDERVAERAEDSWGATHPGPPTEEVRGGPTRDIGRTSIEAARANPESESPTRRIDDTSYPSVFAYGQPQQATYQPPRVPIAEIYQPPKVPPPNIYQPPPVPLQQTAPSSRPVAGINIPEKWATIAPYFPFGFIGMIAAIIELVLVPRSELRTRFHAAQGLALHLVIVIISAMFSVISSITDSRAGSRLFWLASTIFLIVSMIRVWKGRPHRIAPLDELTKWLNDKINPRK
jgi:uncharacterized membrane protein